MEPADPLAGRVCGEWLTYDDVLLLPAHSEVLPRDVSLETELARGLPLAVPVVSAAMDTVTEARLAAALARLGGIGVVHKNMSIEAQAEQVRLVKAARDGRAVAEVVLGPDTRLDDAVRALADNAVDTAPVVAADGTFLGMVTRAVLERKFPVPSYPEVRYRGHDPDTPVSALMDRDPPTLPDDATPEAAEAFLIEKQLQIVPIVSDGAYRGLYTRADLAAWRAGPGRAPLRVGASVGTADWEARAAALVAAGADLLVVDTAHGHSAGVLAAVRAARARFPGVALLAGNVATGAGAVALARAGADAVKVGVGPGSICTTRVVAGVGAPQLSAVAAARAALDAAGFGGVPVVADGGLRYSGDLVKALAAGAACVMCGSLLAGADEAPGAVSACGRRKEYRGMGALEAMRRGSSDRYFQEGGGKLVPEGVCASVARTGPLADTLHQLLGGLRAGMGYCGAATVADLRRARFVRVTAAGVRESHPHDVQIAHDAPNYRR